MGYLQKASRDGPHREESLQNAAAYFDEDLAAHRRETWTLRAIKNFEDESSFIQGDSYTAYGNTTPLAPVREDNEKALERVKEKLGKAACN